MSTRTFKSTVLILLAMSLIMAGCVAAQPAPEQPAPQQPAVQQPEVQPPQQVALKLWHMEQPPHRVARFQELIDKFNSSHPNIVVTQDVQNWNEIFIKAPAAISSGTGPDLLFTGPEFTPIIKELGVIQPVEDLVAELDKVHKYFPTVTSPYSYDGHIWAVPIWNMSHNIWYHKNTLEQAGIVDIQTWDEWIAAAEKLTTGTQYGMGLPANKQMFTDQVVYDLMIAAGAQDFFNDDGTLRFDNPQTVEAIEMYSKLYQYSPPDSPSWAWGEAEACFISKTCAMAVQFSVVTGYDQAGGDPADLGVMGFPLSPYGKQHGAIGGLGSVNGVMVLTSDQAKKDAAHEFIRFLLEPDNNGRLLAMEQAVFLPVTETGAVSKTFWEDPLHVRYRNQVETMIENSKHSMMYGFSSGKIFPQIAPIAAQNLIAQTLQRVVINNEDPAAAVKWGHRMMEDTLD
jgi:multiple sugar transport system substrate-binding protein